MSLDVHEILRRNLNYHFDRTGTEQQALAKFLGVTPGWISNLRSGKKPVPLKDTPRIAEFFKIPLSTLLADPDADTADESLPIPNGDKEDRNAVAPRRRHTSSAKRDRAHVHEQEIKEQRASVRHLERALEHEQAETARLRRMLQAAQTQLYSLHEWFNAITQGPAAYADHAPPRDPRARGVRPPRTGGR